MIVLAGPSGTGKSRLAQRLDWPVMRLDDFYLDADNPTLPRQASGLVDWDDPRSWDHTAALACLNRLCRSGVAEVPDYDISTSSRVGHHILDLGGAAYVVAEGIFAQELVADLRNAGLLASAICIKQHRLVTFVRRLTRDLAEHRKPPWILVTRGLRLMGQQHATLEKAVAKGCVPMTAAEAEKALARLAATL